jgi:hypothetical protein
MPIRCLGYSEARALYRKGLLKGKGIFVFPPHVELETENILLTESYSWSGKLTSQLACGNTA